MKVGAAAGGGTIVKAAVAAAEFALPTSVAIAFTVSEVLTAIGPA